jgi:hypothetical protein
MAEAPSPAASGEGESAEEHYERMRNTPDATVHVRASPDAAPVLRRIQHAWERHSPPVQTVSLPWSAQSCESSYRRDRPQVLTRLDSEETGTLSLRQLAQS